jgi:hypothetical protein
MSVEKYVVYAFSPSLNQMVRRFDLANLDQSISQQQAQQDADNFALLQNANQYMMTTDWQGLVRAEQLGIDTLPGYIGAQ